MHIIGRIVRNTPEGGRCFGRTGGVRLNPGRGAYRSGHTTIVGSLAQNSTSSSSTSSGSAIAASIQSRIGVQSKIVWQYASSSGSISTA